MNLYDNVKLLEEIQELSEKGIHKDYHGLIVGQNGDEYVVCFFNPKNFGENAYANVNKKFLKFTYRAEEKIIQEMEGFFPNVNMEKHTTLTEIKINEYDKVKLIVDKPKYAQEGIKKGDFGCVLQPYAIENKIAVLFYNVGENQEEVELMVDLEDIIIVE